MGRTLATWYEARRIKRWGALVEFHMDLLKVIIEAQMVTFKPLSSAEPLQVFQQVLGIVTGLSVATQTANLFLVGLDLSLHAAFNLHVLCNKRFVDDYLVAYISSDDCNPNLMLSTVNNWHPSITVTCSGLDVATEVAFLDFLISAKGSDFECSTYCKPLCLYQYLPYSSCHARATFRAIVMTEITRLVRTCDTESMFCKCWNFSFAKFRARGYPAKLLFDCLNKRNFKDKLKLDDIVLNRKPKAERDARIVVPFKLQYFPGADSPRFGSVLRTNAKDMNLKVKPVLCSKFSKSLFRLSYARFHGGTVV